MNDGRTFYVLPFLLYLPFSDLRDRVEINVTILSNDKTIT